MSLQHLAHEIAAKGRHGDDTLVHVSKDELAGLQSLAKRHGTSLTVNPQTGLPEAFGLRNLVPMAMGAASTYFTGNPYLGMAIAGGTTYAQTGSLQQGMLAGLGAWGGGQLAAGMAGMGAAATQAGTQVAAGEAAALGEEAAQNAVQQEAARQAAQKEAAASLMEQGGNQTAAESARLLNASAAPQVSQSALEQSAREYASNAAGNTYELTGGYRPTFGAEAMGPQLPGSAASAVYAPAANGLSQAAQAGLTSNTMAAGANAAMSNPGGYIDALGGGWKAAGYGAAALAPAIAESMQRKPYEQPNIKGDSDMGPRYLFKSGYNNDIPGRTGPASYERMTPEEAKKYYGFAGGGSVSNPFDYAHGGEPVIRMAEGGSADQQKAILGAFNNSGFGASNKVAQDASFLNTPTAQLNAIFNRLNAGEDEAGYAEGGSVDKRQSGAVQGVFSGPIGAANAMAQRISGIFGGQQIPDMMHRNAGEATGEDAGQQYSYDPETEQYVKKAASGGIQFSERDVMTPYGLAKDMTREVDNTPVRDYTGYYQQARPSRYIAPMETSGYEPTARSGISGYEMPSARNIGYETPLAQHVGYSSAVPTGIQGIPVQGFQYDPVVLQAIQDRFNPAPPPTVADTSDYGNYDAGMGATGGSDGGVGGGDGGGGDGGGGGGEAKGGLAPHFKRMAAGGIADLGSYSDGGRLLKGPGDGMSDNIPAQIGQKQPARLADGEFVVPADVVSHLGNGSTDAGAKQLYKMMDNIRKARTGRKAQGKQINPRKYLPA